MRTRTSLAVSAVAMTAGLGAMPGAAQAQGTPTGSFLKSCKVFSIDAAKGTLDAECDDGQSWLSEAVAGKNLSSGLNNPDFQYSDCASDISNKDGHLVCVIDKARVEARLKREADAANAAAKDAAAKAAAQANLKYQIELNDQIIAATPGLRAAAVLIFGRDLGNTELRKLAVLARSPTQSDSRKAMFAGSFDFAAASAFLKKLMASTSGQKYRDAAVEAAFLQVYGRPTTAAEQLAYYAKVSAGQAWYATIVSDEMRKIGPGTPARAEIATRVAQAAFGRDPTPAELQQSQTSGQNAGTLLTAARQRLWAAGAVDELIATTARALTKIGRPADDAAIKAAVAAWRPGNAIYAEMIGPVGRSKLENGRPASPLNR